MRLSPAKRNRFREVRFINIITASPRTVHPMCTGFQKYYAGNSSHGTRAILLYFPFPQILSDVPNTMHWDGSDHIYSILPRQHLDRYVQKVVHKRAPYISIAPTDAFMVIPATIIPKSVILVKYEYIIPLHKVND